MSPVDAARYRSTGAVATELVVLSVTASNIDEIMIKVPEHTVSNAIPWRSQPSTRTSSGPTSTHGYGVLTVTKAAVQMDWYFLRDKTNPRTGEYHGRSFRVRSGSNRVIPVVNPYPETRPRPRKDNLAMTTRSLSRPMRVITSVAAVSAIALAPAVTGRPVSRWLFRPTPARPPPTHPRWRRRASFISRVPRTPDLRRVHHHIGQERFARRDPQRQSVEADRVGHPHPQAPERDVDRGSAHPARIHGPAEQGGPGCPTQAFRRARSDTDHQSDRPSSAYRAFVTSPSARAAFRKTPLNIKNTTSAGNSVIFHCTAGKDRIGWTAALLLSILGVDRATIERDYLASNTYRHAQAE